MRMMCLVCKVRKQALLLPYRISNYTAQSLKWNQCKQIIIEFLSCVQVTLPDTPPTHMYVRTTAPHPTVGCIKKVTIILFPDSQFSENRQVYRYHLKSKIIASFWLTLLFLCSVPYATPYTYMVKQGKTEHLHSTDSYKAWKKLDNFIS